MPFVRVPWNEFGIIQRVLDAGAMGVIVPMVNTVEEAQGRCQCLPLRPTRRAQLGPVRAQHGTPAETTSNVPNDEVACIPMIETKQAVEPLDDILAVPGIDAVYVGPADLSVTLGQPPRLDNGGAFEEARLRIVAGVPARTA